MSAQISSGAIVLLHWFCFVTIELYCHLLDFEIQHITLLNADMYCMAFLTFSENKRIFFTISEFVDLLQNMQNNIVGFVQSCLQVD